MSNCGGKCGCSTKKHSATLRLILTCEKTCKSFCFERKYTFDIAPIVGDIIEDELWEFEVQGRYFLPESNEIILIQEITILEVNKDDLISRHANYGWQFMRR
jgi:hypothetical protein